MTPNEYIGKNKWFYENCLKRVEQEKILCAAIWYRDLELKEPVAFNCYNINQGVVICGSRHPHCMSTMMALTGLPSVEPQCGFNEQGFLTNCNRFVDRETASEIAWNAGQLKTKHYRDGKWLEIFSEDLY